MNNVNRITSIDITRQARVLDWPVLSGFGNVNFDQSMELSKTE
jgi:hypothetical protein